MGLFSLFNRKSIEGPPYYPAQYTQVPKESILTADGHYDMQHFSRHEIDTVISVLNTSKRYPSQYQSIGLINECYSIVYKPRYVLHEICIQKYSSSTESIDLLAVALACSAKGSFGRKSAIEYFEKSNIESIDSSLRDFPCLYPLFFYNTFIKLYEQEHQYDKAILCAEDVMYEEGANIKWYDEKIAELERKIEKPPAARKRTIPEDTIKFEEGISLCASMFLNGEWKRLMQ